MIELITNAVAANAVHTLEATGYVTAAIALFEHYTGVGPKLLPGKWSAVPALVLTIGLLAVFALDQGLAPWWLVASVAVINGSLAGVGSNFAHMGAQAVGGRARRLKRAGQTTLPSVTLLAVLLGGCSVLSSPEVQAAGDMLDAGCALGLLKSEAVEAEAAKLGVPKGLLADLLCRVPGLIDAFERGQMARSVDPGGPVLAEARARGVL